MRERNTLKLTGQLLDIIDKREISGRRSIINDTNKDLQIPLHLLSQKSLVKRNLKTIHQSLSLNHKNVRFLNSPSNNY